MRPEFQAALFDMDGTLLKTMRYWRLTALEMLLARDILPPPEMMGRLFKISSRVFCREALALHGVELEERVILQEMENYMLPHYQRDAQVKGRAKEYLQYLRAKGVPAAVATAAPEAFARLALERLEMAEYLQFIADGRALGMDKHDPAYFRCMAQRLGVECGQMCVFEDALYSIRAAKEAGCPVIAIFDESQSRDWEQIQATADACIRDYDELMEGWDVK